MISVPLSSATPETTFYGTSGGDTLTITKNDFAQMQNRVTVDGGPVPRFGLVRNNDGNDFMTITGFGYDLNTNGFLGNDTVVVDDVFNSTLNLGNPTPLSQDNGTDRFDIKDVMNSNIFVNRQGGGNNGGDSRDIVYLHGPAGTWSEQDTDNQDDIRIFKSGLLNTTVTVGPNTRVVYLQPGQQQNVPADFQTTFSFDAATVLPPLLGKLQGTPQDIADALEQIGNLPGPLTGAIPQAFADALEQALAQGLNGLPPNRIGDVLDGLNGLGPALPDDIKANPPVQDTLARLFDKAFDGAVGTKQFLDTSKQLAEAIANGWIDAENNIDVQPKISEWLDKLGNVLEGIEQSTPFQVGRFLAEALTPLGLAADANNFANDFTQAIKTGNASNAAVSAGILLVSMLGGDDLADLSKGFQRLTGGELSDVYARRIGENLKRSIERSLDSDPITRNLIDSPPDVSEGYAEVLRTLGRLDNDMAERVVPNVEKLVNRPRVSTNTVNELLNQSNAEEALETAVRASELGDLSQLTKDDLATILNIDPARLENLTAGLSGTQLYRDGSTVYKVGPLTREEVNNLILASGSGVTPNFINFKYFNSSGGIGNELFQGILQQEFIEGPTALQAIQNGQLTSQQFYDLAKQSIEQLYAETGLIMPDPGLNNFILEPGSALPRIIDLAPLSPGFQFNNVQEALDALKLNLGIE